MKNVKILSFLLALSTVVFLTSCEDDGTGGGGTGGGGGGDGFPTVSVAGPGETTTVAVGDTVFYTVTGTEGDDAFSAITVNENSVALSTDRLVVNGAQPAANPFTQDVLNQATISIEIGIISSLGDNTYEIVVSDQGGRQTSSQFSIIGLGDPPVLETSMMSGTVTAEPSTLVAYPLTATKGTYDLSTISVFEDGTLIEPARVFFDGPAVAENPFSIIDTYADGFSDIDLVVRASTEIASKSYEIVLTDAEGQESRVSGLTIITEVAIDPVEVAMGVIWNRSGMQNGSFDFETLSDVASSNTDADIRDEGNVSQTSQEWLRQISAVNGAELKRLNTADGTTFGTIEDKNAIPGLFDTGLEYNQETVETGDSFIVKTAAGGIYIFNVTAIEETVTGNDDKYEFDIKW